MENTENIDTMYVKKEHLYDQETLDFCKHARIFASVDRLYILGVMEDNTACRVTQLVMETGLSYRQVYYQLSVLRKMDYIKTSYLKGRYIVCFGSGWEKGSKMLDVIRNLAGHIEEKHSFKSKSHLRIV